MHVLLGSEMVTKLNVSREGLILLGMERTAACCVSLLSALLQTSGSVDSLHRLESHINESSILSFASDLDTALLTNSGGRLSPDCISFFLTGPALARLFICASRTEALDSSLLQLSICDANFSCKHSRLRSSVHFSARVSFLT